MIQRVASALSFACATCLAFTCAAQDAPEALQETSTQAIEQCVAQHDSARQLRLQEQWQAARAAMQGCIEERCPLAIVSDCRAWLDELGRVLPTLLVMVEREEPTAEPLRVELDGRQLTVPDPPAPFELLPGPHRLRFELGSRPPIERAFVLQKGEKNHVEQVRFSSLPVLPAHSSTRPPVPRRPVSPATYWLAGGALAAYAGSAGLLMLAVREHRDAQVHCAPACDSSTRNSIESKLILADIAGGVGIALTGLAAYTCLRRPVVLSGAPTNGPTLATTGRDLRLLWGGQF
ncbi:MAG: hypothetical protein ABW061_15585 [Polyangiaceae bacterium]